MATPASHHDTSTPPVATCALPSSTNAVTPWKQEGIPVGKVRHPLDLPLLDPKYSNKDLYQFATNTSSSVMNIMTAPDLVCVINLTLPQLAYEELLNMHDLISNIVYVPNSDDRWTFIWGNDKYSSRKLYSLAFFTVQTPITFSLPWKCQCTPRIKVFAWLMLVDRLNTRVMLRRRNFNIQAGVTCVLCASGLEEDIDHLLFDCSFAT